MTFGEHIQQHRSAFHPNRPSPRTGETAADGLTHEKLTTLKTKAQAGIRIAGSIQSVNDFMAYWLRDVVKDRVRPSTLRTYEWLSRCYVQPLLVASGWPSSNRQLCAASSIAPRTPASAVHKARTPLVWPLARRPGVAPSVRARAVDKCRPTAPFAICTAVGLRRGEALKFRWEDVDLAEGVIFVRQTLQRLGGKLVFGPVKSDESERVIALPAPCLAALRQHRVTQQAERKIVGKGWKDSGLVFTTGIGTASEPRDLNRHFVRLLERGGLRRVRFHDLRHSCATLLYEQGVPIETIQDILGHSSPTITKLIYVEVTRQSQRSTADKLGYLFDA